MISNKDFWRPFWGTLWLQPFAIIWAHITDTSYISNLGWFTLVSTIYLIPIYALYERIDTDQIRNKLNNSSEAFSNGNTIDTNWLFTIPEIDEEE